MGFLDLDFGWNMRESFGLLQLLQPKLTDTVFKRSFFLELDIPLFSVKQRKTECEKESNEVERWD